MAHAVMIRIQRDQVKGSSAKSSELGVLREDLGGFSGPVGKGWVSLTAWRRLGFPESVNRSKRRLGESVPPRELVVFGARRFSLEAVWEFKLGIVIPRVAQFQFLRSAVSREIFVLRSVIASAVVAEEVRRFLWGWPGFWHQIVFCTLLVFVHFGSASPWGGLLEAPFPKFFVVQRRNLCQHLFSIKFGAEVVVMLDVANDIHSLTDFKRRTSSYLDQLRETRRALLLTVNGKAEVAVMSADTFQYVLGALSQLASLQGIRRGHDQALRGEGLSLEEFDRAMREKHGIPSPDNSAGPGGD